MVTPSNITLFRPRQIEIKYALLTAGLISAIVLFSRTGSATMIDQELSSLMQFVVGWGAAGVVLFAFAANAAYFFSIPYTVLMLVLATTYGSLTSQLLLGTVTGVGAAAGASISYLAIHRLSQPSLAQGRLHRLMSRHPRLAPAVVFLGAITPLPDDAILAYLAVAGYPLRKVALPLFTGKVTHTLTLIMLLDLFAPGQIVVRFIPMFSLLILALVFVLYQMEKRKAR